LNWEQVRGFNQSKAGRTALMCLRNVRMGYEIAPLYDDAWTAWLNTEQHKNRSIPLGVDVPLYYSFTATIGGVRKNYGHINVRLKDGRVWNDGNIFSNLASFEQSHSNVSYAGWGESVNKVRVIKENANVTDEQKLTSQPIFNARFYLDTHADVRRHSNTLKFAEEHWLGHGIKEGRKSNRSFDVKQYLANYPDLRKAFGTDYRRAALHYFNNGIVEGRVATSTIPSRELEKATKALNDKQTEVAILQDDVAKLKVELKTLQNEWSACGKANNLLTKENEKLRAELGQTDKWTTFKALIRELFNFKGE